MYRDPVTAPASARRVREERLHTAALVALLLLLTTGALGAPAQVLALEKARPSLEQQIVFEHVAFSYHPALAASVTAALVPQVVWDNDWASAPEHLRFVFEGYPGANDLPLPAEILVFPVALYRDLDPFAAGTIDLLRELLAARPDLRRRYPAYLPVGEPSHPAALLSPWEPFPPFLPRSGTATVVTAHPTYLAGDGASGVRYLAQEAHNYCWSGSRDVTFYTFQGLSHDGAWYVSARFPIRAPFPITPFDPPDPWSDATYAATCDTANATLAADLDHAPAASFTPHLDVLDALVASLRIESLASPE